MTRNELKTMAATLDNMAKSLASMARALNASTKAPQGFAEATKHLECIECGGHEVRDSNGYPINVCTMDCPNAGK